MGCRNPARVNGVMIHGRIHHDIRIVPRRRDESRDFSPFEVMEHRDRARVSDFSTGLTGPSRPLMILDASGCAPDSLRDRGRTEGPALDVRPRNARRWLVVAYTLVTILTSCAHHHGSDGDGASARCLESCRDSRLHLSGHASPGLDYPANDCLACQFRAEHQMAEPSASLSFDARSGAPIAPFGPPTSRRSSPLRLSCRAPPRV